MNFAPFYERCQQLPESDKRWADAFCETVNKIFDGDETQFTNHSLICRLFYGKGKSVSKAQYYRKRKLVRMFYEWLYEQGLVQKDTL